MKAYLERKKATLRSSANRAATSESNNPAGTSVVGQPAIGVSNAQAGTDDSWRGRVFPDPNEREIGRSYHYPVPGSEREREINRSKGRDDAYAWLERPLANPRSLTIENREFLEKHPGDEEGYNEALDHIARTEDFKRGFRQRGSRDAATNIPANPSSTQASGSARRRGGRGSYHRWNYRRRAFNCLLALAL